MYVYPVISKSPRQLPNCLKLKAFSMVSSVMQALILLPFLSVTLHESDTCLPENLNALLGP